MPNTPRPCSATGSIWHFLCYSSQNPSIMIPEFIQTFQCTHSTTAQSTIACKFSQNNLPVPLGIVKYRSFVSYTKEQGWCCIHNTDRPYRAILGIVISLLLITFCVTSPFRQMYTLPAHTFLFADESKFPPPLPLRLRKLAAMLPSTLNSLALCPYAQFNWISCHHSRSFLADSPSAHHSTRKAF